VCIEDAVGFNIEVLKSGMMPAAIEFMDGDIYRLVAQFLQKKLPFLEANAHIIVELDGDDKEQLRKNYNRIGDIALKYGALDVFVGESEKDKEKIWEPRKNTSEALKTLTMLISREDLVVPKDKIPELIKRLRKSVAKYDANLYTFGHLGDGNIHADISYAEDKNKEAERVDEKLINRICQEVYEITLSLGGMITAEHGIGLSKIPFLAMALSKTEIDIMKKIKKIFDPKNILNPGKIFSIL
jgi:glycolate oxidase